MVSELNWRDRTGKILETAMKAVEGPNVSEKIMRHTIKDLSKVVKMLLKLMSEYEAKYGKNRESYKWKLNPPATLRELARSESSPAYKNTICGVHRVLWMLVNVDLNGYIPEKELDEMNSLLETAYTMGKRMDYRLHEMNEKYVGRKGIHSSEFTSIVEIPDDQE